MIKRVLIVVIVCIAIGFAGVVLLAIGHGQAARKAHLIMARDVLRAAHAEYERTGILSPRNGSWAIRTYTNEVQISGHQLRLSIVTYLDQNASEGVFAMATTGEIVWLVTNRSPVIVSDPSYRVPLWRAGY